MKLVKKLVGWSVRLTIYLVLFIVGVNILPFDENWWWEAVGSALYGWLGDGEEAETNTEFLVMLLQTSYVVIFMVLVRFSTKYLSCMMRQFRK